MQNQDIINIMNRYSIRGTDTALMLAVEKAAKVAQFDVPVLVTGENGTGKEVFHRILHDGSRRRSGKCLAINCGGLPEDTITSELFGHVKGAYTGSVGDRKGYFEEADGGTLFLDEVGELPLTVQAKLLRVLENGEIIRMGSNEVRKVNVRIVAATNVDMQRAIREGRFRQDLYYRLSTISIHVPALRERGDDVLTLFRYFAGEVAKRYGMPRKVELNDECKMMIRGFQWPGNVRQLLHVVEELSITEADSPLITPDVLRHYLPASGAIAAGGDSDVSAQDLQLMKAAIYELKLELDEVRAKLGMKGNKRPIAALPAAATPHYPTPSALDMPMDVEAEDVTGDGSLHSADPTPHGFGSQPSGFGSQPSGFGPQPGGFGSQPGGFGSQPHLHDGTTGEDLHVEPSDRPRTLDEIECEAIRAALRRNGGNKRKAAEELGISERTIHRKITDYGLG